MTRDVGQDGGTESERFWEKHYRAHENVWSGRPNAVLEEVVRTLTPGRALDLGCGEGGDAIWLAGLGWRVTAVDVSPTAVARVASRAAEADLAVRIEAERHDLASSLPEGEFDLISAQFFHSPVEFSREEVLGRAASLVAPDGLVLIVDHASVAPWSWNQDPDRRFPTPEETLDGIALDAPAWRAEILEAWDREATGPGGRIAVVTDNVILVRRLA